LKVRFAIRRQRETAVRLAMGAPTLTLLWQMILESLVLSLSVGTLGIGLAALALAIGKEVLPETLPLVDNITFNWAVVAFALLLAVLTGLFCGLAPGFAALRTNVNAAMKEGGRRGSVGGGHARLRSTLVVMEIAIALILLAASGLLLRSFSNLSTVDLGFRPDHVTTANYALPQRQYSTQAHIDTFNNRLLRLLRQLPGVQAVGLTSTLPTTGDGIESFVVDGYVDPPWLRPNCRFAFSGDRRLLQGHRHPARSRALFHGVRRTSRTLSVAFGSSSVRCVESLTARQVRLSAYRIATPKI
jgi:hypothetical protein